MAEKKLTAKLGLDDSEFKKKLADSNNSVSQFGGKLSGLGAAIGIGSITAAFTLIKKGIDTSGDASDRLSFKIEGIQGAFRALAQNIVSLDFSRSFKDAYEAAYDLAEAMDDIQDQTLSVSILDSKNAVTLARLRNDLRDSDLSTAQRLAKEKEIKDIIEKELVTRQHITDQSLAAVNASNAMKYGITTDQANLYLEYLTNYADFTDEQRKQLALALQYNKVQLDQKRNSGDLGQLDLKRTQNYNDVVNAYKNLSPELQKYMSISNIILDYTDKEKQELSNIIIGYNQANASLLRQEGMVDRVGDRLDKQSNSTEAIADNIRKAADAYQVWKDQIHINLNEPLLPGGNPLQSNKVVGIKQTENLSTIADKSITATEAVDKLGSSFDRLGSAIGGAEGNWISWMGNLLQTIPQAISAITSLSAANRVEASTSATAAGTEAAKSVASIPIVGPILAVAAIASVMGAIMSMPKLAMGGLAYGPTTAMIGEYSGASNNPEVVAPLNKLQGIIGRSINGKLSTRLRGSDLMVAVDLSENIHNINT